MASVAYILKAFGRTSETFISNEMYLLERLGISLRIFSLKALQGQRKHGSVVAIQSPVRFLPQATEFAEMNFAAWLWRHVPLFAAAHARVARRKPLRYLATLAEAAGMCVRYRESRWRGPRKVFVREFLQAGYIADAVQQDPDIAHLHAHFCHGATTVTMFASNLTGLPFSFTAHAKDIYLPELNPGDLLQRKLMRAEFAVTCTEANKKHLDGVSPKGAAPVYAVYHGLDTSLFRPARRRDREIPRILSVGRFVEKKGFTYLVDACAMLRDQGFAFECVVVGGADVYQEEVERRIEMHSLSARVRLQTSVTQEQLREIYAGSTIFALPCQVLDNGDRDGIPNVLAEAMAMELPVVSTAISGIPEVVRSEENGLLVPPRDAGALALALRRLLDDAPLRRRLGAAARQTILEVFDSRKNTQTLAALFAERLGARVGEESQRETVPC